jgi:hypothetical protein
MQAYEAFPLLHPVPLSAFGEAFDKFTSTAFRLECLPIYTVEEEHSFFLEYKSSGKCSAGFNSEWLDFLNAAHADGKTVHRSRVLPKTGDDKAYFRFEVDCGYRLNVDHGEVVTFLEQEEFEEASCSTFGYLTRSPHLLFITMCVVSFLVLQKWTPRWCPST